MSVRQGHGKPELQRPRVGHWGFPRAPHLPLHLLVTQLLAIVAFSGFIKGKHLYVVLGGKTFLRH